MRLEVLITEEYHKRGILYRGKADQFENPICLAIKDIFTLQGLFPVYLDNDDCVHVTLSLLHTIYIPLREEVMQWLLEWAKWKNSWKWWIKLRQFKIILNMPNHTISHGKVTRIRINPCEN